MRGLLLVGLLLTSCGYSSRDNEGIGQVKRVYNHTPVFCPDYHELDLSLGVMRNGVGSMSTEDIDLELPAHLIQTVKKAAESGHLIKVNYDLRRFTFCVPERIVTSLEVIN